MKYIFITLLASSIFFNIPYKGTIENDPINAMIGDDSFLAIFNETPLPTTSEELRVKTHLQYVERILREKDTKHLSPGMQQRRTENLDLLHAYWNAGSFPRNYDHPDQRKPCFIDKNGNICAVGYLVEKTAGRAVAEIINNEFKYEYITRMHSPILDEWIANSGLTVEECAMIQPTYGGWGPTPTPVTGTIEPGYAISSSVLTGTNATLMAINGIQMLTQQQGKVIPAIGLITGTGQLVYGIAKYPTANNTFYGPVDNPVTRNVSMLNIGLGTGTVIISMVNLFTHKEDRRNAWNVFSAPIAENQNAFGLAFTRQF